MSTKKNYDHSENELEFQRTVKIEEPVEEDLENEQWEVLEEQNTVEFYPAQSVGSNPINSVVLEQLNDNKFNSEPLGNKWESVPAVRLDLEEDWEEDAWLERWRLNPEKYLVTALPPDLSQRLEEAAREKKLKRNEFVLKALEDACRKAELDKIRRRGLAEGEPAKLIKDPKTGIYRCFPADFFTDEELYGYEVIEGKYYRKNWEKTENGWIQVNKGYFEASGDQDAPYIKMVNNKPVGSWEVYPFEFFEHDWKWGIYDNKNVVIEVIGRKAVDGQIWLDVFVDNELVDSVKTSREVHRIIMQHL